MQAPTIDGARELIQTHRQRGFYFACKRLLDILIAGSLLIVLSPLILVTAVLVKLDSRGPSIFKQERVGTSRRVKDREESWEINRFTLYKFRSMRRDADAELHCAFVSAFLQNDQEGMATAQRLCREASSEAHRASSRGEGEGAAATQPKQSQSCKLLHDPRVTRLGRFLRRSSLDELPQLWNVLKGEMSLVGPRPDVPYSVENYRPWHFERLHAKPGLTGLWQVEGRSRVLWDDLARMDIEYIHNQSLWLDLKILMKTPRAVLRGEGAV